MIKASKGLLQENFKREFRKRKRMFYPFSILLCKDRSAEVIPEEDEMIFMTPLGSSGKRLPNGLRLHVIGPKKDNEKNPRCHCTENHTVSEKIDLYDEDLDEELTASTFLHHEKEFKF